MNTNKVVTRYAINRFSTYLASRRNYSSGVSSEENYKAFQKWNKLSYAFFPAIVGVYVYNATVEEEHHEVVPYKFMKIRSKDFPWGDGDTDLFVRK